MKNALLATLLFVGTVGLTACGTLTGIPSHGGGKRFAVEQELVAASARAAAKEMDLSALQGRKVALYISTMGDQGSGNISGGRYSIDALIRGEYLNTSKNITDYSYPRYITTANTNAGSLSSVTSSQSILNAPSQAINHSKGDTAKVIQQRLLLVYQLREWEIIKMKRWFLTQEMFHIYKILFSPYFS